MGCRGAVSLRVSGMISSPRFHTENGARGITSVANLSFSLTLRIERLVGSSCTGRALLCLAESTQESANVDGSCPRVAAL